MGRVHSSRLQEIENLCKGGVKFMKPIEIVKDIFIVGGSEITDSRDACVYLLRMGELVLIDSGAGWSFEQIINNIKYL